MKLKNMAILTMTIFINSYCTVDEIELDAKCDHDVVCGQDKIKPLVLPVIIENDIDTVYNVGRHDVEKYVVLLRNGDWVAVQEGNAREYIKISMRYEQGSLVTEMISLDPVVFHIVKSRYEKTLKR